MEWVITMRVRDLQDILSRLQPEWEVAFHDGEIAIYDGERTVTQINEDGASPDPPALIAKDETPA